MTEDFVEHNVAVAAQLRKTAAVYRAQGNRDLAYVYAQKAELAQTRAQVAAIRHARFSFTQRGQQEYVL